jgi:uncharacterized protein involved in exopolysaccharide biosynthesis
MSRPPQGAGPNAAPESPRTEATVTTDDRYDIDLGEYLRGLAHWWWIVVVLAIVGAVVAAGVTHSQPKTYVATSSVYLGQPTNASGSPITALNTDPRAAIQIGTSESTYVAVAKTIGLGETAHKLRVDVSITAPALATKTAISPINIVTISVTDTKPVRAAAAANAIAAIILQRLAAYGDAKVALLTQMVATDDARLAQLKARSDAAQKALAAIAAGGGPAATRAMAAAPYLGIVQSASDEQQALLEDRRTDALTLLLAKGTEAPAILARAAPPSTPQPSSLKTNVAIGALVGLVVGLVVAAVLDWRRRARRPA